MAQLVHALEIGLLGAGRMGQAIVQAIAEHDDLQLAGVWVRDARQAGEIAVAPETLVSSDIDRIVSAADVVVDFSLPEATAQIATAVLRHRKPLVCGVSGLSGEQLASLDEVATAVPVVYDRNMSAGVAVLERLVRQAAASLGLEFEAQVHETHHIHKKDAPSGTALKLGEAVADARDQDFGEVAWYAPQAGSRSLAAGDIHFEVERRAEVPGDHSVTLASPAERLTLSHSVTSRQVFADGALRAARWVARQDPGRYQMQDVLFGNSSA